MSQLATLDPRGTKAWNVKVCGGQGRRSRGEGGRSFMLTCCCCCCSGREHPEWTFPFFVGNRNENRRTAERAGEIAEVVQD